MAPYSILTVGVLALTYLPLVYSSTDTWDATDCYSQDVYTEENGVHKRLFPDDDHNLRYDWELTKQTCDENYPKEYAIYDFGSGRCVALEGYYWLRGPRWWNDCKSKAERGYYKLDQNGTILSEGIILKGTAEGRGYSDI